MGFIYNHHLQRHTSVFRVHLISSSWWLFGLENQKCEYLSLRPASPVPLAAPLLLSWLHREATSDTATPPTVNNKHTVTACTIETEHYQFKSHNITQELRSTIIERSSSPAQRGWRGAWSNRDRTASPGPALTTARCPGLPPKCHPSCAAAPGLYCRRTRSLPGHACAWPHPPDAASLGGGKAAELRPATNALLWDRRCASGSHRVCSSASPCTGRWCAGCCPGDAPLR